MVSFIDTMPSKLSLHECGHSEHTVLYNNEALYGVNRKAYFKLDFSKSEAGYYKSCDKNMSKKG